MQIIGVLTTTATREAADALAAALVERRLAACVHVQAIESWYAWEGEVRHEPEFRLLAKTTAARYADVEAAIRELHDYELPAIVAFDFDLAFGPYADWVSAGATGGD